MTIVALEDDRHEMTQNADNQVHTVLDYIDQIKVPGDVFKEPANEYWALVCLSEGLRFLARQVVQCETTVQKRLNSGGTIRVFSYGNLPEFRGLPMGLLTCVFQWYAISACQYVRTVGMIAKSQCPDSPGPLAYVNEVIPDVKVFRDKVAAHFAWSTSNRKDNDAERMASILPNLAWVDNRFAIGGWSVYLPKGNGVFESGEIPSWSVSAVHGGLCERYWKESVAAPRRDMAPDGET